MVELDAGEQSPFLGDITPGQVVTASANNLYLVPMAAHSPRNTDFLVIKPRGSNSNTLVVRPLPKLFTMGQMQPRMRIPNPFTGAKTTRDSSGISSRDLMRARMAHILARAMKRGQRGGGAAEPLKHSEVLKLFRDQDERSIRRNLRVCRGDCFAFLLISIVLKVWIFSLCLRRVSRNIAETSGCCDQNSRFRSSHLVHLIPLFLSGVVWNLTVSAAEMECVYESMLAGQQRLLEVGLTTLSEINGIDDALKELIENV